MTRARSVRAIAAGAVAVALAFGPASASAEQYVVDHCTIVGTGAPAAAFGLSTGATTNTCGRQGGSLQVQKQNGEVPGGTAATIVLSVPADRPNIQIERVITQYSSPAPTAASPPGAAFMPLQTNLGQDIANSQPPASPTADAALPPGARSIIWNLFCTAAPPPGPPCAFADQVVLTVQATRLYLDEGLAPTLAVTGGTLVGPAAKSGLQSMAFDAADTDSGVSGVSVAMDATEIGSLSFACAFDDWSACPREQPNQVLQVDTRKVPDGNHELFVTVRDAANNPLTRSLGIVTVANGPGPAAPNGVGASRLAKLSARFATTRKRSRTLRFAGSPTVTGTLRDERGQPITGATVALLARPRRSGAATAQVATATTGAEGAFSAKLPGGPSRTITFAYTAFSGDAKPASTATLRTTVRAIVSARVAPRSSRPGGRITLTGKLRLLPRKGIEVKIQARQGRIWRTLDDVRTAATGRFRWRYRFAGNQARRTYAFRARVASALYPFASANSTAVRVRVR